MAFGTRKLNGAGSKHTARWGHREDVKAETKSLRRAEDKAVAVEGSKETWPAGPWHGEPDHLEFEHAGLPCLLHRSSLGAWCGYAAVPPGHPAHGKNYDAVDVDVHGGLTYGNRCQEGGPICHVPKPGEPADVWWLGFDCGHYGDIVPEMLTLKRRHGLFDFGETYKDLAYVCAETMRLAEQLAAMGRK